MSLDALLPAAAAGNPYPGTFVVLEGMNGVGKTTLAAHLEAHLTASGREVVCVREPGSTPLAVHLRALLLDPLIATGPEVDLLLFSASRRHLLDTVVRPALARGAVVLCDRFALSTFVYQGAAGAGDADLARATDVAVGDCWPDQTVVLTLPLDQLAARLGARRGATEKFEADERANLARNAARYEALGRQLPRTQVVPATGTEAQVMARVLAALAPILTPPSVRAAAPSRSRIHA